MGSVMETVKIEERLISRIGVREWGLPTLVVPGQIWRSEKTKTITCMVANGAVNVSIRTLPLKIIPPGELSVMPDEWRAALWEYVKAYPYSGCGYGPFLAITKAERCAFIRELAKKLVESDDVACRSIADDVGKFAAFGYELVEGAQSETAA
jgi:hypothetical protein